MKHQKLLVTVALRNWLMLFPKKHDQLALHFVLFLEISGRDIGMQISHPTKIALDDDRNETYLRALRNSVTSDIQMVVCIVSDKKKDRYNAIKRFCTCERPVPCQVVIQKNLAVARLMMKMTRNIAIQLNCKLGGEAWTVHIPFVVPVMVIGIDTYPDMSMRNWSVCGVVCSMNTICTRFYSRVIFYESHDELINRLMPICREGLRKYQQRRGVLPENIFIYRDGVREGQLDAVVSRELPRVKEIFQLYRENYSPHLSFIVVNKQVNTRLFIRTTDVENPPPGTVVDSVITKQECHNFFMVSDSRGTLSPTHYTVIFHNSGLLREYLQRFTFKLTHLYYNMPRTIRVPAPCQYAHKLASLVGQSLHGEPSIHLADRLYYL
ncbi:piwi-like protein Ago3 [Haliotis rubra]|uniref:piwi-like protein Ago3 n=1 Tax=Haliotis rubra TaxID=36100 RepID=UPI001EE5F1AB|nr:piwi-like protein Ago3 [Haliotis rubra]